MGEALGAGRVSGASERAASAASFETSQSALFLQSRAPQPSQFSVLQAGAPTGDVSSLAAPTLVDPGAAVSAPGAGLTINVTYDSSVASAPAAFKTAVAKVVQYYESQFSDHITINLHVGYGEVDGSALGAGALGESQTFFSSHSYAQLKSALASSATSADDQTAMAHFAASDPTGGGTFWVSTAEAKALGLSGASSNVDGYVGFSSTSPFDYDNTNGVSAGQYDFFGAVAHEISEVMGRSMFDGATFGGHAKSYEPLDLFHYASSGVRTFTGTTPGYFSINGGATNLDNFNTNSSGDFGDWAASAGHDSFLAFSNSGVVNAVTETDLKVLDVLGYHRPVVGLPDLVATNFTFDGTTAHWTVKNIGTATSAATTEIVTFSADPVIATGILGGHNEPGGDDSNGNLAVPSLAPGASVNLSETPVFQISYPYTTPTPGQYYLSVYVDWNVQAARGSVAESHEDNNLSNTVPVIFGNGQANTLTGTSGKDTILAGGGGDRIIGTTGNDFIDGGGRVDGYDTVDYSNIGGGIVANLITGSVTGPSLGTQTLKNIQEVIGGPGNDVLTGNGDDTLNGGPGNDTIHASGFNTQIFGGPGNDYIDVGGTMTRYYRIDGGPGVDTVALSGDYSSQLILDGASFLNIELMTLAAGHNYNIRPALTYTAGQTLTVDASTLGAGNTLTFDGSLSTSGGAFVLKGGAGADVMQGGSGSDVLDGGAGNDTLNGGSGNDTASYASATAGVTVSLAIAGAQNTIGAGTDTLIGIENLTGSNFNDHLTGSNGNNVLTGGLGADVLIGGSGKDTLIGGAGADTMTGGAGNDTFQFSSLTDSITAAPDLITDFASGDRIDLHAIDADTGVAGDQAFHLGGGGGHAGDIVVTFDGVHNRTVVQLYVNNDATADATIWLSGAHTLSAADFVL